MKITNYGHACFGIEINDKHIVIDPFITGNPLAKHIDLDTIKADYILITHAHQDHVLDVEVLAEKTGATIVSNYEITTYYVNKGLKGYPMNHGGTFKIEEFSAKYVKAVHTSSFADGTYGGEPGGFVISSGKKTIYVAGDTALTLDMKLITHQYKINLAILPIGGTFTMDVEDALITSRYVKCDKIIGCHYNTFPPIEIDAQKARAKFDSQNKLLLLPKIGEVITV